MGKKAGASHEELEFIFGCFLRGLSNREVLEEIQDTEYPRRNPRFIRDRRRHFDEARKVLEQHGLLTPPVINWIEDYQAKLGELPLIPEFMLPVVKDKTAKRVSKNMELSIPSAQWWNGLSPFQQEQVLQTVDWLSKHKKDWWCKSREDYLEMTRRLTLGKSGSAPIIKWKR